MGFNEFFNAFTNFDSLVLNLYFVILRNVLEVILIIRGGSRYFPRGGVKFQKNFEQLVNPFFKSIKLIFRALLFSTPPFKISGYMFVFRRVRSLVEFVPFSWSE